MNSLKMNSVIYKIQDLVIQKELKSFEKFKNHFQDDVKFDKTLKNYKFISKVFKNIYTFLKELRKHPKSIILVQAMKPMFEMLLFEMIMPKFINIFDEEMDEHWDSANLKKCGVYGFLLFSNRRTIQTSYNSFVIPYKDKTERILNAAIKREKNWNKFIRNRQIKYMGLKAYHKEIDKLYNEVSENSIFYYESKEYMENSVNEERYLNYLDYEESEGETCEEQYEEFAKKFEKMEF